MIELPKRSSLVAETAQAIRAAIREGAWEGILPGERVLAERLQVSRPTVHAAMEILQREGLLEVRRGGGRKILGQPASTEGPVRNCVGVLASIPLHLMPPITLFYLNELRDSLQQAGFQLEVFSEPALAHPKPQRVLERVVRQAHIRSWVLSAPTPAVQEWFAKGREPVMVAGTLEPGIPLPSIDLDYRAVCRHAAGVFLRAGHQQMVFFMEESGRPADELSEEGFFSGISASRQPGVEGQVVHHDGTAENIFLKLGHLLARGHRPTALLMNRTQHALAVLTYLLRRRVGVPQDVSLISRDSDSYLNFVTPKLARYSFRRRHFADRLSRLVVQLAVEGSLPPRPHSYMPDYEEGETVAAPPAAP
jgi:DNA-binding LacI/PurR family transcriptional regulator